MKRPDIDLLAGLAAILWAILAVPAPEPMTPQLAELCSAYIAGPFGLSALVRWYNRKRSA